MYAIDQTEFGLGGGGEFHGLKFSVLVVSGIREERSQNIAGESAPGH